MLVRDTMAGVLAVALKEQDARMDQKLHSLRLDIRDEIHSVVNAAVFASEDRIMNAIVEVKDDILDGVSELISDEILPQIDEHARQIGTINRYLKLA